MTFKIKHQGERIRLICELVKRAPTPTTETRRHGVQKRGLEHKSRLGNVLLENAFFRESAADAMTAFESDGNADLLAFEESCRAAANDLQAITICLEDPRTPSFSVPPCLRGRFGLRIRHFDHQLAEVFPAEKFE